MICTDEFGPLGRAEAQVLGIGALPLIAIPHPLAGNERDLISAKATAIAANVERALTGSAAEITATHVDSFTSLTERRLERGAICVDEVCAVDPGMARSAG